LCIFYNWTQIHQIAHFLISTKTDVLIVQCKSLHYFRYLRSFCNLIIPFGYRSWNPNIRFWKASDPNKCLPTCPVIQTIGVESICASIPVTSLWLQDLKLLSLPYFPLLLHILVQHELPLFVVLKHAAIHLFKFI
jgi:hypothetical protein